MLIQKKLFSYLQFCATRKGVQQAASVLSKDAKFLLSVEQKQRYFYEHNENPTDVTEPSLNHFSDITHINPLRPAHFLPSTSILK